MQNEHSYWMRYIHSFYSLTTITSSQKAPRSCKYLIELHQWTKHHPPIELKYNTLNLNRSTMKTTTTTKGEWENQLWVKEAVYWYWNSIDMVPIVRFPPLAISITHKATKTDLALISIRLCTKLLTKFTRSIRYSCLWKALHLTAYRSVQCWKMNFFCCQIRGSYLSITTLFKMLFLQTLWLLTTWLTFKKRMSEWKAYLFLLLPFQKTSQSVHWPFHHTKICWQRQCTDSICRVLALTFH
jgi:hypothetical protein